MKSPHLVAGSIAAAVVCTTFSFVGSSWAIEQEEAPQSSQEPPAAKAAHWVRQALAAEATGDSSLRANCLREALIADPEYAPARWHSGEVHRNGRWLSADALSHDAQYVRAVDKYRTLRDAASDTVYDQLRLARHCEKVGLKEQERVHQTNVFRLAPNSPEATKKLGLVRYKGKFLYPAEAEALQRRTALFEATQTKWLPKVALLRMDIESNSPARRTPGLNALREIRDVEAIPALEFLSSVSNEEIGGVVVGNLANMHEQAATESLARHAVFAPSEVTRHAASEALKSRSIYAYVPMFLSALQMPIDINFATFFLEDGRPAHRLELFQEGEVAKRSFVSEGALSREVVVGVGPDRAEVDQVKIGDATLTADIALATSAQRSNTAQLFVNARCAISLQNSVGEDFGPDPKRWWDWWAQYNELAVDSEKPVSYASRSNGAAPVAVNVRYRPNSCFVAGTQVVTMSGPMPIEKIAVGECVLSQNAESGEITFKPVVLTTKRPPSPVLQIRAGGTMIRSTRGHPMWVSGCGWQMAKELKVGQWLHTINGPIRIVSIEPYGEAPCYNLVVADFDTYFVGDDRVLVHDNNMRNAIAATVPGFGDS